MRWKRDALRLALGSISVALGGVLFVGALANAILRARGEPAPSWGAILAVLASGAVLLGVPGWLAYRDLLAAARRAREGP